MASDEMSWLRASIPRFMVLFRKERLEQELDEELRSNLEMLVEENRRKGSVQKKRAISRRGVLAVWNKLSGTKGAEHD